MASVVSGYEYDIFISYRQKDNKYDGWVTDFVNNLRSELEATFKEEISVYFDQNPHDGIQAAHDVDDSLKAKIKCLVFIPIISQTYCDPNSFAWKHEFLAFRDFMQNDRYGPKVRVAGGNVISRILPVRIHELDEADKKLFESEVGSVLRPIDFIFSAGGVNRPLAREDRAPGHASYRDQINKVAQSIKQLITGLRQMESGTERVVTEGGSAETVRIQAKRRKDLKSWVVGGGAILIIMLLTYFALKQSGEVRDRDRDPAPRKIAVLPFANLSGNPEYEYISDGITGEIITHIAKISDLKVIARSSVIRYKGTTKDIVDIGKELGVDLVLEGTVRLTGDRSRISANLINTTNREQIWGESYDREIKDLFKLQADVANDIVTTLRANFQGNQARRAPTSNLEAYDLYLQASYNFAKASKEGYRAARELCEQAVKLDDQFALAYALLADSYSLIFYYQFSDIVPLDSARARALTAARKSIQIDPSLSEGYSAYGYALRTLLWDWQESEIQTKKGLSINPDNTSLRRRYALLLALQGRFDEAIAECNVARDLDPLGSIYNSDIARIYYYAGRTNEALRLAQYAFGVEPNYRPAMGTMAILLERLGKLDSSVVWVSKSSTRTGTDYEGLPEMFNTKPKPYSQYWSEVLERSIRDSKSTHISCMAMAILYLRNKDLEHAMQELTKGFEAREGNMVYINVEPMLAPLHSDPRFTRIVKEMGLDEN